MFVMHEICNREKKKKKIMVKLVSFLLIVSEINYLKYNLREKNTYKLITTVIKFTCSGFLFFFPFFCFCFREYLIFPVNETIKYFMLKTIKVDGNPSS